MSRTFKRREILRILGISPLLLLQGFSDLPDHIDREWFRNILRTETGNWLKATVTPSGFFQMNLDRKWNPTGKQIANLVSQPRQLFVMATGYELTHDDAYLEALKNGTDFLIRHFSDDQFGGLIYSVSHDGSLLEDKKDSYGTAFSILGLSHSARITGDIRYREAALKLWYNMKKNLRDDKGFFSPVATRDYSKKSGTNSQNPMMHLFEALLALYDLTQSGEIFNDAQEHANNIFTNLFNDKAGYLPEVYDENWNPLPADTNGRIDLGHQFEWSFLLSLAVEKGFPKRYLVIGERLLEYGMKIAYDTDNGGIFSVSDYEGKRDNRQKTWWQQTELLRTLMHYATLRNRNDLWNPFHQSLDFVKQHFIDPEYGGWYEAYNPSKPREGNAFNKGSNWQAGYHVSGMYAEALRLTGGF